MRIARVAGGVLGLLAGYSTFVAASAQAVVLPTPDGFQPCSPADPVAATEAHVATKIGAEFLSCFRTSEAGAGPSEADTTRPQGYALAIALPGKAYKGQDLDALLSKVKEQWRNFDPLSAAYKETYTARLNALIRGARGSNVPAAASIKPVLVAIVTPSKNYYVVTSIRSYVWRTGRGDVEMTKVNSDAVVLRGSRLIRLTVQRKLSGAGDVEQVQTQIGNWAKAIARS